jgi:hypothetical protein
MQLSQASFSAPILGPSIFLSTVIKNTLSLHTLLNVKDQISHPYNNNGQNYNSVYTLLIFILLESDQEDKRFWIKSVVYQEFFGGGGSTNQLTEGR